ncbi:MAG: class I SAM-dependent methyltransferase [Chloroflexi bacterium]|nr:class I SAM-dependent methyltransferase [Chloroflexota bacterium]
MEHGLLYQLYHLSLFKVARMARRWVRRQRFSRIDPDSPSRPVPELSHVYLERRQIYAQRLVERVRQGEPLDGVLSGFNARNFDERLAEYPYFVWWLYQQEPNQDLLDVGCTLNNKVVSRALLDRCRQVWLTNPAYEAVLHVMNQAFYHVSKLEEAFPDGKQFPLVTCLSTIEHIGYDNSQYGKPSPGQYGEPSVEPLVSSLMQLVRLMQPGGRLLVSVPFGYRQGLIHPVTMEVFSQVFDAPSIQVGLDALEKAGVSATVTVYQIGERGWDQVAPEESHARYADGTPGAGAVAFITGQKAS